MNNMRINVNLVKDSEVKGLFVGGISHRAAAAA
jgi:hypothetical protein